MILVSRWLQWTLGIIVDMVKDDFKYIQSQWEKKETIIGLVCKLKSVTKIDG